MNDQLLQYTFRCTCGPCPEGFLSPRTAFALKCQADAAHDTMRFQFQTKLALHVDPMSWSIVPLAPST